MYKPPPNHPQRDHATPTLTQVEYNMRAVGDDTPTRLRSKSSNMDSRGMQGFLFHRNTWQNSWALKDDKTQALGNHVAQPKQGLTVINTMSHSQINVGLSAHDSVAQPKHIPAAKVDYGTHNRKR